MARTTEEQAELQFSATPVDADYLFLQNSAIAESKGGKQLIKWLRAAECNEKRVVENPEMRFDLVKCPEFAQWVNSLDMDGQNWLAIAIDFALAKRNA